MQSTQYNRAKSDGLHALLVTSKTDNLKKSYFGLTFIRSSKINHPSFTARHMNLDSLVEFYRSPDRIRWSPTGTNIPDYPKLAQLWWQNIGDA